MPLILALLFTLSITVLFGRTAARASRSGLYQGIGWSVSRAKHPIEFWFCLTASSFAGLISLAFSVLIACLTFR